MKKTFIVEIEYDGNLKPEDILWDLQYWEDNFRITKITELDPQRPEGCTCSDYQFENYGCRCGALPDDSQS